MQQLINQSTVVMMSVTQRMCCPGLIINLKIKGKIMGVVFLNIDKDYVMACQCMHVYIFLSH